MCIYNPKAIDYSKGTDIYDPIENKYYTEDEARSSPQEVKSRLLVKGRKLGCWVLTAEEATEIMNSRRCKNEI